MKPLHPWSAALLGLLCTQTFVGAATYSDFDLIETTLGNIGASVFGSFNIAGGDGELPPSGIPDASGFDPAHETLVSATATFSLSGEEVGVTQVSIFLGGFDFAVVQNFASIDYSDTLTVDMLVPLQSFGVLDYVITLDGGSVQVVSANLVANTASSGQPGTSVNDEAGVMLGLLGVSALGMMALHRRRETSAGPDQDPEGISVSRPGSSEATTRGRALARRPLRVRMAVGTRMRLRRN